MFLGFFAFLAFGVLALVTVGAVIATVLVGASGTNAWIAILATPLVLLAAVAIMARYAARTWRPVRNLIAAAGSLADGDYTVRVPESGSPAIRPVLSSFNTMARRLETADEQRRRLLADVGHELRTPLTVVRAEIEAMLDGVHRPDVAHLEVLLDEVTVMERLLEDLRTLSLAAAGALALHLEPSDVTGLVSEIADTYRRSSDAGDIAIVVRAQEPIGDVLLDPVRIREVLSNVIANALRAMPEGGTLTISLHTAGPELSIEVADTGVGVEPDEVDHVFDRFMRGSTSSGSGLGLTISRDLVEAHGGTMTLDSTVGVGTVVRLRLPLVRAT